MLTNNRRQEKKNKSKDRRLKLRVIIHQVRLVPDVDDDSDRPHVQRAVVAFVPQDFGSKISRRADHRTPERLFADDPSKTKVTQLHLKQVRTEV